MHTSALRFRIHQLFRLLARKRHPLIIDILDETRPGRPLPVLPPELWVVILRYACSSDHMPDPLDTSQPISFLSTPHLHHAHYCASMRQKCSFSLVNKQWYQYTQEVLYEFVWISRAAQAKSLALTLLSQACAAVGERNASQEIMVRCQSGRYIRRLHIETSTMERCDPADLRTILDYSPQLVVYSDQRSVRRNLFEESCDPRSSPQQLFSALAHPNNSLRRLSWTNYDDADFHLRMSPTLQTTAANLEYLELTFISSDIHSTLTSVPEIKPSSIITLRNLRSLKITLDNAAFHILSAWSMPRLINLSVLSADFSYALSGFEAFFRAHGGLLQQLELIHSSSSIEQHWLTIHPSVQPTQPSTIPLASWCPNLREFICSADAEWSWQNPDWIAPHVLLPAHPTLKFIGIRDIDKRLRDDLTLAPSTSLSDPSPYFPLLEQLTSLLNPTAFPSLMYIRDLSRISDVMRKESPPIRVVKFWETVLTRCKDRGIWLEDWRGVNLTRRDLERVKRCARA